MANEKQNKPTIVLENNQTVECQEPVIVSASRSTDIPAFYSDWFFHRLNVGYSVWTNPFNGKRMYISYNKTRFIVFWSKNPRPLLEYLPILEERNIKCYIQFTLNDYEKEKLEKVPSLENRIETFKLLSQRLGKESVIWRFDPLILTKGTTIDDLLEKARNIGDQLKGYTEKLVFSYADISQYAKVTSNLKANGIEYQEWTAAEMDEFAKRLSAMNIERGWGYTLATCGEKIDLEQYGIRHNRCIDGDLITRLAWEDKELMGFMKVNIQQCTSSSDLFGGSPLPDGAILLPSNRYFISSHKKDHGQRELCGCMVAKDIGEYNTCPHLCEYCYANTSKNSALKNYRCHKENPWAASITGR